jgi:WD40 repeat protein
MTSATAPQGRRGEHAGSTCPYRGLVPFTEHDSDYFFGRGAEREIIAANLIASRLTLLYAPSGVGKSSVLLAGVVHDLGVIAEDDVARGAAPEYVPVVVRRWREDPLRAIADAAATGVRLLLGQDAVAQGPAAGEGLLEQLAGWAHRADSTLLLVLDQFEEFLLYHGEDWEPGDPAYELAQLMSATDAPVNVLIALREDALAGLDRFKGRVPHLFENYLRLKLLDRRAAREAIEKPIAEWNRRHGEAHAVELEPALVEAVLDQLGEGRVTLARGSGQGQAATGHEREIEAPFLQLVLMRVWDEELAAESRQLRRVTLERLGGAGRIVSTYLDDQLERLSTAERRIASAVFHQLVTPSGSKIAHTLGDLADYTGVSAEELGVVLDKLSAGDDWRILRSEAGSAGPSSRTYEIFHDVLAEAVLDWRGRFEEQRAASDAVAAERSAARRRRRRLAAVALALVAIAAFPLAVVLISEERRKANEARDETRSTRLASSAGNLLADNPELAILLAQRAQSVSPTPDALPVMRAALIQSRSRGTLPSAGGAVTDISPSPDGRTLVGSYRDGHIRFWYVAERRLAADRDAGRGMVTGARFSGDGSLVASTTNGGEVRVWRASDGGLVRTLRNPGGRASDPRWSEDGSRLLALTGRAATVWSPGSGARLRIFRAPGRGVLGARWTADGGAVVLAASRRLQVRSVRDGHVIRSLGLPSRAHWIRVSADGRRLVASLDKGQDEGELMLWDLESGVASTVPGIRGEVHDVQFDNAGERFAVGAGDPRIRIHSARDGSLLNVLPGANHVSAVRFAGDGKTVFTAGDDRTVRIQDVRTGEQRAVFYVPDHLTGLTSIPRGPAKGLVVTTTVDGDIRLWEAMPTPAALLDAKPYAASARFGRDGRGVVVATALGLHVWDSWRRPAAKRRIFRFDDVTDASISPDGRFVATAYWPEPRPLPAQVFELASRRQTQRVLRGGSARQQPVAAAFSPDGRLIATADADGAGSLWSTRDYSLIRRFGAPRRTSAPWFQGRIAFVSRDVVAVSGWQGAVRLVDIVSGRVMRALARPDAQPAGQLPAPIAAAPDRARIAVGGADGVTRIYGVSGDQEVRLPGNSEVHDIGFNRDGSVIATVSDDGALRLWDTGSAQPIGVFFASQQPLWSVDISRDGRSILALGHDDRVRVFRCEPCGVERDVLRAADRRAGRNLTPGEIRTYDPVADG